jgi:hypothetical protein
MNDPYAMLAGAHHGVGRSLLDSVISGAGFAVGSAIGTGLVSGLGSASEVHRWPEDRKQGLTFGEVQELGSWIRNRILPPLGFTDGREMYPESAHYRALWAEVPAFQSGTIGGAKTNELGERPAAVVEVIVDRWNALKLSTKRELVPALRFMLGGHPWSLYRAYVEISDDGEITWRTSQRPQGWPPGGAVPRLRDVANAARDELGLDAWYRLWAALAIGRDLFAEEFEKVGGVQLGLQDRVEELQAEGAAVTGRWEVLAGRWVWKGWDVGGRPLLSSEPLLPAPVYAPARANETTRRNRHVWRWLFNLIRQQDPAAAAQVAGQMVPTMTANFNQLARVHRDAGEIEQPPATVEALGELFANYWNLLGLDLLQQLEEFGGEDFAAVVREQAVPREGELFETPVAMPVAESTGETDVSQL